MDQIERRRRRERLVSISPTADGLLAQAINAGLTTNQRVNVPQSARTEFFGKSFIEAKDITSRDQIDKLFEMANAMGAIIEGNGVYEPLRNYNVAELFYEASTRTSLSFESAAKRLGATVFVRDGMRLFSSVVKKETLEDTIHAACQVLKCDVIVLRHKDDDSSERAKGIGEQYGTPIINAGSGALEHPTQALLDLYTIDRFVGRTNKLRVMMIGDLKYGRTNKSLAKLLAFMDPRVEFIFVAPEQLKMPRDFLQDKRFRASHIEERDEFVSELGDVDVIYMTRVQTERFPENEQHLSKSLERKYTFTTQHADLMKPNSIIMHPLPRVKEIEYPVDNHPRAAYMDQMGAGLYIRMALLHEILLGHQIVK